MATEAELTARLDKLRRIRAAGVETTRFGNDEVTYRSDAELATAIADLERQIDAAKGIARAAPVQFVNFRTRRGW